MGLMKIKTAILNWNQNCTTTTSFIYYICCS